MWVYAHVFIPVFVIGMLIVVHEFGHFIVAKWCGVGVLKFAIGFGPAIYKFRRKETEYQIGLIPLGGFVRMVGDMPDFLTGEQVTDDGVRGEEASNNQKEQVLIPEVAEAIEDRSKWFIEKSFWQKSAIVVAGPLFNFFFSLVIVFFAVIFFGKEVVLEEPIIGKVMSNSPAQKAGLKEGDAILQVSGDEVTKWKQFAKTVHDTTAESFTVKVERNSQILDFTVSPKQKEVPSITGKKVKASFIGVSPMVKRQESGILGAAYFSMLWTLDKTIITYTGLFGMIVGNLSAKDLAGPLFIIDAAGEQAKQGFDNVLYFMALLSVSLAVLNLLPIPVLDGGHLLFFIIEAIIGPLSIKKKELAQQVGLVFLLGLTIFAIHNDITRDNKDPFAWDADEAKKEASSSSISVTP